VSTTLRAQPLSHHEGARVWACIGGEWRAACVLAASGRAVLVRHLLRGRGTSVETVVWHQLAAAVRVTPEQELDGGGGERAAGPLVS
jgi:hypothetical protein